MGTYRLLIALQDDGSVGGGLGRAHRVAVCDAGADQVSSWSELTVGWDATHDTVSHGTQHDAIRRVFEDERIQAVVAGHAGTGMRADLNRLDIAFFESEGIPARAAAMTVARLLDERRSQPSGSSKNPH